MVDLNKRYVRVKDGVIVEPYVSLLHINNRKHDPRMYHEVISEKAPVINKFESLVEVLTIEKRFAKLSYTVVDKDVNQVLSELHGGLTEQEMQDGEASIIDIILSTVEPETVQYVLAKVKEHVGKKLDAFANERDYESIVSLCSYATSTIAKFQTEGQRGVAVRDLCYASLYQYLSDMTEGTKPVPKSLSEVDAVLPELTW